MTALDDILEPYASNLDPRDDNCGNRQVCEAIKAAYRLGHDDGRMARIRQDQPTFIEQLRESQDASQS